MEIIGFIAACLFMIYVTGFSFVAVFFGGTDLSLIDFKKAWWWLTPLVLFVGMGWGWIYENAPFSISIN